MLKQYKQNKRNLKRKEEWSERSPIMHQAPFGDTVLGPVHIYANKSENALFSSVLHTAHTKTTLKVTENVIWHRITYVIAMLANLFPRAWRCFILARGSRDMRLLFHPSKAEFQLIRIKCADRDYWKRQHDRYTFYFENTFSGRKFRSQIYLVKFGKKPNLYWNIPRSAKQTIPQGVDVTPVWTDSYLWRVLDQCWVIVKIGVGTWRINSDK